MNTEYATLPRRGNEAGSGEGLTERQRAIFTAIFEAARDTGIQPSMRELMDRFGIRSPNGIRVHLRAIQRKGWLAGPDAKSRSQAFLKGPSGRPFAGFRYEEES